MRGTEIVNTMYFIWSAIVQVRVTILFQVYSGGTMSHKTIIIIILLLCGAYNSYSCCISPG